MAARTVSLRADPEAPLPGSLRAPRRLRAVTVEPAAAPAGLRASVTQMLRRAAHPALGCACLVVAFALCLTLASFNPADPSFNVATGAEPRNWLGAPGAHAADLLLQWLGAAAYLPVAPLAMWGALGFTGSRVKALRRRVLLILPAVLLAAMALAALPGRGPGGLEAGLGGIGGAAILSGLSTLLDIGPAIPIMPLLAAAAGAGALALLAYAAGWTWTGVAALSLRAGRMIAKPVRWIVKQVWPQRVAHDAGGDEDDEPVARKEPMLHRLWRRLDDVLARLKRRAAPSRAVVRVEPAFGEIEDETPPETADTLPAAQLSAPEPRREPRVARPQAPVKESRRAKAEREPMLDLGKKRAFELPALSLLARPKGPGERESDAALEASARVLESVLADFGVRGAIGAVRPGPVVTLYELEPAAGIKASRVIGLADDIARSMSAVACRVAVVPGRNVIGIELPNRKRDMVFLRELLSANEYENGPAALNLALGKDISGAPVFADLARMPHVLIAGTTGSGKSVGINTMILSLLYRHAPEQCRLIMIDPKMLELSVYEGIPHLLAPVVTEPKKAIVALKWAVREMEDRYRKMAKLGVRNIDGFNERVRKAKAKDEILKRVVQTGFDRETGEPVFEEERLELDVLPFIVVIIDEMADLMIVAGKEIEALVQRLAQMARAAGIHVIMATQRPSVDVITGTIKANFPTRVSFQVTSKIDSRTILGEQGAEQLLGQGDMLFMAGGGRIRRVHGAFVTDDEVIEVVKHLKTQGFPDYVEAVTADPDEDNAMDAALGLDGEGGSGDDLYDQAVAIVKRDGRVSTSYIQRRLQIGYNRAARIIERMEEEGVVTAPNHQGKREILGYEGP